jgi:hypothetical protein
MLSSIAARLCGKRLVGASDCVHHITLALQIAVQRDCRKTPGSKHVHKNLPGQAQKLPKYGRDVVLNIQNQALFSVSLPLFKNHFLKRDFFDSFNGSR